MAAQCASVLSAHASTVDPLDLSPAEVADRVRHRPGTVFFDSALDGARGTQLSVIAAEPSRVLQGTLNEDAALLRERLRVRNREGADFGVPAGFLAGSIDYDGTYCFGEYENALIYRHANASWMQVGDGLQLLDAVQCRAVDQASTGASPASEPLRFRAESSQEEYCAMVRRAQGYIAAGDIYQVNLAHRFSAPWSGDAYAFYEALRHYSPAPYCAYLDLGGRRILSTSPECFLDVCGRAIRTRPIKGTRPRRADGDADERSAFELITSPKEVAELVMITDLERNDLGQVCDYGTVAARDLLALERFEQVFHLVSTVEGRLRRDVDHVAALCACFPGGSITGAPKKRAREIIAELERTPRGLYTGAIGWLGFNGESRFSIAIRTAVIEQALVHFHVGAGIVADSIAECEWQETLDKAAGILLAAERLHRPSIDRQ